MTLALPMLVTALVVSSSIAEPIGSAHKGAPVRSLVIEGFDDRLAKRLREGLALAGERKLFGRAHAVFYPGTLADDLERTALFLSRNGYPHARVTGGVREVPGTRGVDVVLTIETGPPVRVASFARTGVPPDVEPPPAPALAAGVVFRDADATAAERALVEAMRRAGYAHASVRLGVEPFDSTLVAVRLVAVPGDLQHFGALRVEGAPDDLEGLTRREAHVPPGVRFDPRRLARAETNLRLLGLFRRIRIETEASSPGTLGVVVRVSMRAPRTAQAGIGYWTDEQFRGSASWEHRNLFSGGRGARAAIRLSRILQSGRVSSTFRGVFGTRTRGSIGAELRREDEEAYRILERRLDLTATRPLAVQSDVRAGVGVSSINLTVKLEAPEGLEQPPGVLTFFFARAVFDGTDDPLDPSRGSRFDASAEIAPPGLRSVVRYVRGEAQIAHHVPIGGAVLATRALVGAGGPIDRSRNLLASRRFFAGGAVSMRGYKRRQLGPRDAENTPLGGRAKIEGSVEVRAPLFWLLSAALFWDVGQVYERLDEIDLAALRSALGSGLLVATPIGPVRLDIGVRLGDAPEDRREPRQVVHVTIGQPF